MYLLKYVSTNLQQTKAMFHIPYFEIYILLLSLPSYKEKILARQLQLEEERRLYDELERNRIETAQLNMTRQNEASQHPSRMKLLGHARIPLGC